MTLSRRAPHPFALLSILALALVAVLAASAAAETCENVCDQTYALCIGATCTDKGDGTAYCRCTVIDGWSVGPEECSDIDGLVSRFSTALYDQKPFYEGSGRSADCYGKSCIRLDDTNAICTCDVNENPQNHSWWSEAGCEAPPLRTLYSAASSPFGGGLKDLADLIATCSDTTAPTPQPCNQL